MPANTRKSGLETLIVNWLAEKNEVLGGETHAYDANQCGNNRESSSSN